MTRRTLLFILLGLVLALAIDANQTNGLPPPDGDGDLDGPPPDGDGDFDGPPPDRDGDFDGPPPDRDGDFDGPPPDRDGDFDGPPRNRDGDSDGPPADRDGDFDGPPPDRDGDFDGDKDGFGLRGGDNDGERPMGDNDGEKKREKPPKLEEFDVPEFDSCTEEDVVAACLGLLDGNLFIDIENLTVDDVETQLGALDLTAIADEICVPNSDASVVGGCLKVAADECENAGEELPTIEEAAEDLHQATKLICGDDNENVQFFDDFDDYDDGEKKHKNGGGGGNGCFDTKGDNFLTECNGNGECVDDRCKCFDGWKGKFCSKDEESHNMQLFGTCAENPETGELCSGYTCNEELNYCECGDDFFGQACEWDPSEKESRDNNRKKEKALLEKGSEVSQAQAACKENNQKLCPPASEFEGECRDSMEDCGLNESEYKDKRKMCMEYLGAGDYGDLDDGTVDECASLTAPQPACTGDDFFCWDGTCAASEDECSEDICAAEGLVSCGDGVTCAEDGAACVFEYGVLLEGCPAHKPYACTAEGFPCKASWEECWEKTFCNADAPVGCFKSYTDEGEPIFDDETGKHTWVCAADADTCIAEYDILLIEHDLSNTGEVGEGQPLQLQDSEGNAYITINSDSTTAIGFQVKTPSNSELDESAFSDSNLISAAIEIVPDSELTDYVEVTLAITTPLINGSCEATVALLDPRKVSNIRSENQTLADAGNCNTWVEEGPQNCACVFTTTAFSTVALVDVSSEALEEESVEAAETSAAVAEAATAASESDAANTGTTTTSSTDTTTGTTTTATGTTTTTTGTSPASRVGLSVFAIVVAMIVSLI